jgi:hypothetical protein
MRDSERRVKVVSIPVHHVLDWFTSALSGWPARIALPVIKGVPTDAQVLSHSEDFFRRRIDFLISHPSFEPVEPGVMPPEIRYGMELVSWPVSGFPGHAAKASPVTVSIQLDSREFVENLKKRLAPSGPVAAVGFTPGVCHACDGRGTVETPTADGNTVRVCCSVCGG